MQLPVAPSRIPIIHKRSFCNIYVSGGIRALLSEKNCFPQHVHYYSLIFYLRLFLSFCVSFTTNTYISTTVHTIHILLHFETASPCISTAVSRCPGIYFLRLFLISREAYTEHCKMNTNSSKISVLVFLVIYAHSNHTSFRFWIHSNTGRVSYCHCIVPSSAPCGQSSSPVWSLYTITAFHVGHQVTKEDLCNIISKSSHGKWTQVSV